MKALRAEGFQIGRYRVRNLMKNLGLIVKQKRRFQNTTDSEHDLKVCDNLLDRKFAVETPNQVWTTVTSGRRRAGCIWRL